MHEWALAEVVSREGRLLVNFRSMTKQRILTGDRPTGPLHLGHYVGSLKNRVKLQADYEMFIVVADYNVLTRKPEKAAHAQIKDFTRELVLDYLSVGLDPDKVTIYRQSDVPSVTELTLLLGMIVTVAQLQRVPTLKEVMAAEAIEQPSYGLLGYPVLQAADILHVKAELVPVGKDQEAHLEITRELARRFNRMYQPIFPEPRSLIGDVPILPGIDGAKKMSKSLGNAINLSDDPATVAAKVKKMYTDPKRIHPTDPGTVEGNPVFIYHDAFNDNPDEVADLKARYRKGTVSDVEVKERLIAALERFLAPIRERRARYAGRQGYVEELLAAGAQKVRPISEATVAEAKQSIGLL